MAIIEQELNAMLNLRVRNKKLENEVCSLKMDMTVSSKNNYDFLRKIKDKDNQICKLRETNEKLVNRLKRLERDY